MKLAILFLFGAVLSAANGSIRSGSGRPYAHLFNGSKALKTLAVAGDPAFSVTFQDIAASNYFRFDKDHGGSVNPAFFRSYIESVFFYKPTFNQASARNTYQVDFPSSSTLTPTSLEINGRDYPLSRLSGITITRAFGTAAITETADRPAAGSLTRSFKLKFSNNSFLAPWKALYENEDPPQILTFTAFPSAIDLDPADNARTASVTFGRRATGDYRFIRAINYGSSTGWADLAEMQHCYINAVTCRISTLPPTSVPSNVHFFLFYVARSDPNQLKYSSITLNGRTYPVFRGTSAERDGSRAYWTRAAINSADYVTDGRLTLSIRFNVSGPADRVRLAYTTNATRGQVTTGHIVKEPGGTPVGSASSSAVSGDLRLTLSVARPDSPTTYRVIASNAGGSAHRDAIVSVTKNPTLASCRRVGFNQVGRLYTFGLTMTGLPRPTLTYSFSRGPSGTIVHNLILPGSNDYTYIVNNFRETLADTRPQSLTFTATNASGSATCRIDDITN